MSDLTICSHCGIGRYTHPKYGTYVDITTLHNGNNELTFSCGQCGEPDIIQITPAEQDVYTTIDNPISGEIPDIVTEHIFEAINSVGTDSYPLNSKWQNPDNGFIFEVLKHLESSVMLYNETVGKGVTYDMEKMSKLVKYETL